MRGVVAAGDKRSVSAGIDMLVRGGNAFDAAVAAAFTTCVVEVLLVNIGGGGFATYVVPEEKSGKSEYGGLEFFCAVPSRAFHAGADFRAVDVDFGRQKVAFHIGRASTAVPGGPAGLLTLHAKYGRLPRSVVMQPAIMFARKGFSAGAFMERALRLLNPIFSDTAPVRACFQPHGEFLKEGEWVAFPELADSLEIMCRDGLTAFYKGELAKQIIEDQEREGGLITAEDLASYRPMFFEPMVVPFREYQLLVPPEPSLGGALIAGALLMWQRYFPDKTAPDAPHPILVLAHILKITEAVYSEWFDGADDQRSARRLLSEQALDQAMSRLDAALSGASHGSESRPEGPGNTAHISAWDRFGHAVSITLSAGEAAGYFAGSTGMMMNNMLGEEDLHPRGFHRERPGTRLASMMSPLILCKDGKAVAALGSSGSSRIISNLVQAVIRLADGGQLPQSAVDAPRIHHQNGVLHCEKGMDAAVYETLEAGGFKLNHWDRPNLYFGAANLAGCFQMEIQGAGDPRRYGVVQVV